MKARFVAVALVAVSFMFGCATSPRSGSADRSLVAPQNLQERRYLGLSEGVTNFYLEEISCEVLVIDCFDMYCHICQSGAKHVNELYALAQERGLGTRVKFVGLGLGDTAFEAATYKQKFKVPFPVFPDRRSAAAKQFGPVRLPNLIVLRKRGDVLEVARAVSGPLSSPAGALSLIQSALGEDRSRVWDGTGEAGQPTCEPGSEKCRIPAVPSRDQLHIPASE
jgi:hypothetical protein